VNWKLIGELIQLRYKLMWAKTRSRNGKIALFAIGYLLFLLIFALLAAGGFGAGIVAIRTGKAEQVAEIVLSGLFLNAVFTTILLGFGMSAVFSDVELRRYPIGARERFVARHFLGIVDPFWFLVLALEMGLAVGLYTFGSFSLWNGAVAVVLLVMCGYLLTRVIGLWIDQLMATRSGSAVVLMLIMCLSLVPGSAGMVVGRNPKLVPYLVGVLRLTPPFGAATAMTHTGRDMFYGLGMVACWMLALAVLLIKLERRPASTQQTVTRSGSNWDGPLDKVAALFGPQMAPLVGHWLRFYVRNNRFRMLYLFSLPLATFLAYSLGQQRKGGSLFVGVLGAFAVVAIMGTSRIAVNQFGYVGGAFRRFFLFPIDPAASLRAASYTSVLLGAAWIPVAAIIWAIVSPRPFDIRMVVMPVLNAITALFLFNGLGLWTTLYAPKRGNYDRSLGNDMSLMGNIAVIGVMLTCMFLPQILHAIVPWMVSPENWWITLPPAAVAIVFYLASLRGATAAFPGRREAVLAVVEGKA
jgi:hypothetical protein